MNVIELLANELKNKNWTLEEKQRYIYLRTCQLFSFDIKYNLCKILPDYKQIQQDLRNRTIDLTNVTDFNIVCTSYSKQVINVLLEELLNIKTTFEGNDHNYVTALIKDKKFKLDATLIDIYRIKMNMDTTGYQLLQKNGSYEQEIIRIDKKIGYIKDIYGNQFVKSKKEQVLNLTKNVKSEYEYFTFMMNLINNIYKIYNVSNNFSDAKFCIDYLIMHLINDYDREYIKDICLFLNNDNYWDYINIYIIDLEDDIMYWCLEKEKDKYCLHEISKNKAKYYIEEMKFVKIKH